MALFSAENSEDPSSTSEVSWNAWPPFNWPTLYVRLNQVEAHNPDQLQTCGSSGVNRSWTAKLLRSWQHQCNVVRLTACLYLLAVRQLCCEQLLFLAASVRQSVCASVRRKSRKLSIRTVVLNLGSRDPLGFPNAYLGGPKRKSGISTNFPQCFCLALFMSCFCVHTTHPILFS